MCPGDNTLHSHKAYRFGFFFFFSLCSSFQVLTQTWFSVQKVNFQLREVSESYPTEFSETKVLPQLDNYGDASQEPVEPFAGKRENKLSWSVNALSVLQCKGITWKL